MTTLELIKPEQKAITQAQGLENNPAAVYLAGLTDEGRRVQKLGLDKIAGILTNGAVNNAFTIPWAKVEYAHAQAVRSVLQKDYKPASANRILSALRGTLKAAWLLEQVSADHYQKVATIAPVMGETIPAGRGLDNGEKKALMDQCGTDPTPAGVRDSALIALMAVGGLRRAEVVKLTLADYEPGTGQLKVLGKRNKERIVYLANGALDAMSDWLVIRGSEPGALFMMINKSGRLINKPLTPQALYAILQKRQALAGVKHFSPHDLRRTFVSDLLDAGVDIAIVAKMAGHSSVNTTARYDKRPELAKQKAAATLHIPYTPRNIKQ